MSGVAIGVAAAVAAGVGVAIHQVRQGKRNAKVAMDVEPVLRERGPITLPALCEALGVKGTMARGKVAMALNELASQGRVTITQAPEGTPQLQKVNHITYGIAKRD